MTGEYVALGSSMAAGPGIRPRVPGSPRRAARSARNYPHLVAAALGLGLIDVTYSGATTANVLHEPQYGAPPQIDAVHPAAALVTITIGGNDVGYVPMLSAAALPGVLRGLPFVGARLAPLFDTAAHDDALVAAEQSLRTIGEQVRGRAPRARVVFVDYPTVLPPPGEPARPLSDGHADLGRHIAGRLAEITAAAAESTGCELVSADHAGRAHHAWSDRPWTVGAALPIPGRPAPFHPNAAGMRAVADLVVQRIKPGR